MQLLHDLSLKLDEYMTKYEKEITAWAVGVAVTLGIVACVYFSSKGRKKCSNMCQQARKQLPKCMQCLKKKENEESTTAAANVSNEIDETSV